MGAHLEMQVDGPVRRGGAGQLVGAAQEDAHAGGLRDLLLRRLLRQRRLVQAVVDLDVHAVRRRSPSTSLSASFIFLSASAAAAPWQQGWPASCLRATALLSRGRLLSLVTPALGCASAPHRRWLPALPRQLRETPERPRSSQPRRHRALAARPGIAHERDHALRDAPTTLRDARGGISGRF